MSSLNKVILIGRVGRDVNKLEKVSFLTIATEDGWGNNKKTNWHSCKVFGKLKEIIDKYCVKGQLVSIVGSLEHLYDSDKKETKTTIVIDDFKMLSKPATDGQTQTQEQHQEQEQEQAVPKIMAEEEEDLPF